MIGKSTTISVLSGNLPPTFGSVHIAGLDMLSDLHEIHRYIGICAQHDVLWAELSVKEHLAYQARQRGVPSHLLYAKVQEAALAVGLDGDGFDTLAGQLSGGMRR